VFVLAQASHLPLVRPNIEAQHYRGSSHLVDECSMLFELHHEALDLKSNRWEGPGPDEIERTIPGQLEKTVSCKAEDIMSANY
jgi:hypothetical protein